MTSSKKGMLIALVAILALFGMFLLLTEKSNVPAKQPVNVHTIPVPGPNGGAWH